MKYLTHTAKMEYGDSLLLYTDEVTDASSNSGEVYSDMSLQNWFASASLNEKDAASLVAGLVQQVTFFVDVAEASDDITCLNFMSKTFHLEV